MSRKFDTSGFTDDDGQFVTSYNQTNYWFHNGNDNNNGHQGGQQGVHNVLYVGANSQYHTIQSAVDAAHSGDTILVAAGTYAEQVVIGPGKDGLTIQGNDHAVITAPTALGITAENPNNGRDIAAVVTVNGANDVTITHLTVDGAHRGDNLPAGNDPTMAGIAFVNADQGVIDHVDVTGVRGSDATFGDQRNVGIYVTNNDPSPGSNSPNTPTATEAAALHSITITHSTVEDFQKTGIVVSFANVDIDHNTVTGIGPTTATAQNGIQISDSTGSVDHNSVTGIDYASWSGWSSTDILAFENRGLVIDHNTITENGSTNPTLGITQLDSVGGTITHNSISGVGWAIDAEDYPTSWGWPDPMLPGTANNFTFDYSNNSLNNIGFAGLYFAPDPATTAAFNVIGTSGNEYIAGGAGNDVLNPGRGNAELVGNGGNNIFVFQRNSGNNQIDDFTHVAGNSDVIDVSDFHFKHFAALLSKTADDGSGNAVIHLTNDSSITLIGVHTAQLTQADFIL